MSELSVLVQAISSTLLHADAIGSDWFRHCIGRQMLAIIVDQGSIERQSLLRRIPVHLHAKVGLDDIVVALDFLLESSLAMENDGIVEPTVSGREFVADRRQASREGEERLRDRYLDALAREIGGLPHGDLWRPLRDEVLAASALAAPQALLSEREALITTKKLLERYVASIPSFEAISPVAVQHALTSAIDLTDAGIRRYLASLHGAAMFAVAVRAPNATRELMTGALDGLSILLDTNVLFSIVGAHANPANAAAAALAGLGATEGAPFRVAYLPESLAEARRAITTALENWLQEFPDAPLKPAVAKGLLAQRDRRLYGLNAGFVEHVAARTLAIDARTYFEQLSTYLPDRLKSAGVLPELSLVRPDNQKDQARLRALTRAEIRGGRKTPLQRRHDYLLREVCRLSRGPVTSLASVKWWVASADWELVDWDAHAARVDGELPCVLHVISAFNLVGTATEHATDETEAAAASVVEHPLLYTEYDNEAEALLIRVASRVNALRDWSGDDEKLLAGLFASDVIQGFVTGQGSERREEAVADQVIDKTVAEAFARLESIQSEREESLRRRVAELEERSSASTPSARPGRKPKHRGDTPPQGNVKQAQEGETSRRAKHAEERVRRLETQLEAERAIARRTVPVWVVGAITLGGGVAAARLTDWLTLPQAMIVAFPIAMFVGAFGIHVGPQSWRDSTLGRMSRWLSANLWALIVNILAAAAIAVFFHFRK